MTPEDNEMSGGGTIFSPLKEGDLLHQAEIMTLRQIGNTLQSIASELQASRADMIEMKIDVAVIKERQTQNDKLQEQMAALAAKIEVLETRNAMQDGAFSFAEMLQKFGPWLLSLLVLAWSLLPHTSQK